MASVCFLTFENCRKKSFNSVTKKTNLGNGGVEKVNFLCILHPCQVEPQVALLEY